VVERIDDKGTYEAGCEEDNGVDKSNNPLITTFTSEPESLSERKIGAIRSSLIPTWPRASTNYF
jgi:hypothetical protein